MGFMVAIENLAFAGERLTRPECVLAHQSGLLFVPDWRGNGGVSVIVPDSGTHQILAKGIDFQLRPNGIALEPGGSFLCAHLGADAGGVYRLFPDGTVDPFITEVDGTPLPPTNFVLRDEEARVWITVSTRQQPRSKGYRADITDGFIVLVDQDRAKMVADGLGYANECALDIDNGKLFVNETFARRLSVFDLNQDGHLTNKQTVAKFAAGTFPDGLARDCEGGLWVTSIVSNRVIRVTPDGEQTIIIEDSDQDHINEVEAAYQSGQMDRSHLDQVKSSALKSISNLAFGGPDLKMAYLGCLLGDKIACFSVPFTGVPLPHWDADLGPLKTYL